MLRNYILTKKDYETFIENACLSEEEILILKTHLQGWSRVKQAYHLHISVATLDRRIARLARIYDRVQEQTGELLPRK